MYDIILTQNIQRGIFSDTKGNQQTFENDIVTN